LYSIGKQRKKRPKGRKERRSRYPILCRQSTSRCDRKAAKGREERTNVRRSTVETTIDIIKTPINPKQRSVSKPKRRGRGNKKDTRKERKTDLGPVKQPPRRKVERQSSGKKEKEVRMSVSALKALSSLRGARGGLEEKEGGHGFGGHKK